jgi:hypothetical protein
MAIRDDNLNKTESMDWALLVSFTALERALPPRPGRLAKGFEPILQSQSILLRKTRLHRPPKAFYISFPRDLIMNDKCRPKAINNDLLIHTDS